MDGRSERVTVARSVRGFRAAGWAEDGWPSAGPFRPEFAGRVQEWGDVTGETESALPIGSGRGG